MSDNEQFCPQPKALGIPCVRVIPKEVEQPVDKLTERALIGTRVIGEDAGNSPNKQFDRGRVSS
jgi:hypothetical protein